jgi:hypothetical protein
MELVEGVLSVPGKNSREVAVKGRIGYIRRTGCGIDFL